MTIFSPRASAMAHHIGDATTSLHWTQHCNDLIQRVCALYPENFVGVCQLPQTPGDPLANCIAELERCIGDLGFIGCNLNPDPSGGYWARAAADRQVLVSVLREDGRARRAGDGPRQRVVQPELPRDRRALHQRRHDRLHAVPDRRSVQGFPGPAVDHSARRRRRALPLGPLPRPGAGHEAAAARRADPRPRLFRHLRLSHGRHRAAARRSSRWTTSCSARKWSAPCAASIPRRASISTTRSGTSTRARSTPPTSRRFSKGTRGRVFPRHQRPDQSRAGRAGRAGEVGSGESAGRVGRRDLRRPTPATAYAHVRPVEDHSEAHDCSQHSARRRADDCPAGRVWRGDRSRSAGANRAAAPVHASDLSGGARGGQRRSPSPARPATT